MVDWIVDDRRPVEEVAAAFGISERTSGETFRIRSTSRTGSVACKRGALRFPWLMLTSRRIKRALTVEAAARLRKVMCQ